MTFRVGLPLAVLLLLALAAVAAPMIVPHDPVAMNIAQRLSPPSAAHWLGQDEFGRDILSRLVAGGRASLAVALASALLSGVIGVTLGLIGGYFRGFAESFTLRLTDVVLSVPPVLLALLIVTIAGPGVGTLILALSILYAPGYARLVYGEVLTIRELEYVEAARALGASRARIILRAVLPAVMPAVLVQLSITIAGAIVIESGLSFLGLGVVPPTPSWGLMIRGARTVLDQTWLPLLWPCLALLLTVNAANSFCDALRDALDPRLASARIAAADVARSPEPTTAEPARLRHDANDHGDHTPLLDIVGLETRIATPRGEFAAVADVTLSVGHGETVALVGESGSGKTMIGLSILGLLPNPQGRVARGSIVFAGRDAKPRDLVALDGPALQAVRGNEIAMIFQEPMTSLNPVLSIGRQIGEALACHRGLRGRAARRETIRLLEAVGIANAPERVDAYAHEMSGGMRQRAGIAMALACEPLLVIADEPTTALDVTVQAQILDLLKALARKRTPPLAMLFITHNLGIVAEQADRVVVLYAGRVMEEGPVAAIFRRPRHPYTRALIASMPGRGPPVDGERRQRLQAIRGQMPSPFEMPTGCPFADRCDLGEARCTAVLPPLVDVGAGQHSRCLRWQEL